MFKIKLYGNFNSSTKIKKGNSFQKGMYSFYFFTQMIRFFFKESFVFRYYFLKKRKYNVHFIKSNIRYKVSKHLVNRVSSRFSLDFFFFKNLNYPDFFFFFKKFKLFSFVFFNTSLIRVFTTIRCESFLKY